MNNDVVKLADLQYKCVQILPDIHAPWVHWKAFEHAVRWRDRHKPDLVVQLGDLTDQKIWSRWQSDTDDYSPSQEYDLALKALTKIHRHFPNMYILRGNHDDRIKHRATEAGIPAALIKDVDEAFNFAGWNWVQRNQKLVVNTARGDVLFLHGDEMGGTVAQKSRLLGMNVICGHTHKTSITYTNSLKGHIFGAEMGCLMDAQSKAGRYAQANPIGVSLGFGVLKHGIPYFIPYDKGMRV